MLFFNLREDFFNPQNVYWSNQGLLGSMNNSIWEAYLYKYRYLLSQRLQLRM